LHAAAGFHLETFFPLCGKIAKIFSIVWKKHPSFFHTVENFPLWMRYSPGR